MTIPGMPAWAQPDPPPRPAAPVGLIDPPFQQTSPDEMIVVYPMNYPGRWGAGYNTPTPWDDATQINDALLRAGPGGHVRLVPGIYNIRSTIVVAGAAPGGVPGQRLSGSRGTILLSFFGGAASNTGACVSSHGSETGGSTEQGYGAIIELLTLDGTNVPPTAICSGLDYGDQYHGVIRDVTIQNFTASGSTNSVGSNPLGAVGLNINNQVHLTEKLHVERVVINNCGTPNATSSPNQGGGAHIQLVTTTGTSTSRMYSDIDVTINTQPHQNGLVLARQGHLENGEFKMRGNMNTDTNPANCAAVVVGVANPGGGSPQQGHIVRERVDIWVESDGPGSGAQLPFTFAFGTNADNTVQNMEGRVQYLDGFQSAGAPAIGQFQMSGRLHGDNGLASAVTPAATLVSGTTYTNNNSDMMMHVSGGTVSSIAVNGVTTNLLSGSFLIPASATFVITAAPMPLVSFVTALAL